MRGAVNTMPEAGTASVSIAESDAEIDECFECLRELRPNIERETFCSQVRSMEKQSYRLAYAKEGGRVVGVAGYRYMDMFYAGKSLYVDDLVVSDSVRSSGIGTLLIDWLRDEARRNACDTLHLDSGVQRDHAHKFYFDRGMHISSFHFVERL